MTITKPAFININQVSVAYASKKGPVTAIEHIDKKINQGDFICVLGPSGCGKSTLLKVIAGFIQPTKGTCQMEDELITQPSWERGVVFQDSTLYPWMSVQENIQYGLKMRQVNPTMIKERTESILEKVGLLHVKDAHTFELSGGMQQRVAVARTLVNKPKMILMDEPFGALDALTRLNMQGLTRDLWQEEKTTVFLITHDIDEAMTLGNRVWVMSKNPGKIEKEYQLDYTYQALTDDRHRVSVDDKYLTIKNEILDIIGA